MSTLGGPGKRRPIAENLVALCVAGIAMAGCGSDAKSTLQFAPTPAPGALVTGVVSMPNGELASASSPWQWARKLHLSSPLYAATTSPNPNIFPTGGVPVTLSRVDDADAADGIIGNTPGHAPLLLGQSPETGADGTYTVDKTDLATTVNGCGFMVAVGDANQGTLTRAWVLAAAPGATDIDVVSETVVRVVLDRLTKSPPVDLCRNFPLGSPGLQGITDAVAAATFTAVGSTVQEMNDSGFQKAMASAQVTAAVTAATGVAVAE